MNDSVLMSNPTGGVSDRRQCTQPALHDDLMARVVDPANLRRAWKQVKANQGAPGSDGVPLEDFPAFAREHWPTVRQALLDGTYQPAPVRRVAILKPGGRGERLLGIPTVRDRVIAQAIAQVLTPLFDPDFSASSFGFRPGGSRPWSDQAGTAVYRRGLSHGRGAGLGKVLRPGLPRRAACPRGSQGVR